MQNVPWNIQLNYFNTLEIVGSYMCPSLSSAWQSGGYDMYLISGFIFPLWPVHVCVCVCVHVRSPLFSSYENVWAQHRQEYRE